MAKPRGRAAKRASAAGRARPQGRKSGARKASKSGSRKSKPAKSATRQKPSPLSESARLKQQLKSARLQTREALQQQTATADVLKVISRSAFDLEPALVAICETASRLCDADQAAIFKREGDLYDFAASFGFPPEYGADWRALGPRAVDPKSHLPGARSIVERRPVHVLDLAADPAFHRSPSRQSLARTALGIPLLRDGEPIGNFVLGRRRVEAFTDRQIELVQTFADQAVIAIENARLFDEVQARTRDLTESLQQQIATADVLKVISRSAFDLQSVFDTLARSAADLCAVRLCGLHIREGDFLICRGYAGASEAQDEIVRRTPIPVGNTNLMGRALSSGEIVNIGDFDNDPTTSPQARAFQQALGFKALLFVPMMREGNGIGVFVLGRDSVGEFSQRHIDLVQTFADQAVIAIENVRLFEEVQAKTRDLTESLQQQTATADVLKVISRSAFDLDAVMNTLTRSAAELCKAELSALYLRDGDLMIARGMAGVDGTRMDFLRNTPLRIDDTAAGRSLQTGSILNMADVERDGTETTRKFGRALGFNSILFVPLMREDRAVGVFALGRKRTGEYSQREVDLVQTFADQAVIAIENVRLFNETQEALEQQKASADILSVISSSVSETQPVFDEILRSVARLFGSEENYIFLVGDDDLLHVGAGAGRRAEQARALFPARLEGTVSEVAIRERRLVRSANVLDDPDLPASARERYRSLGENYAMVLAPMLWEDRAIGSVMVARTSMKPFSDKECKLLSTFADQAVIAIQNARLFNETKEALERQTATSDILNVIAGSPTDTRPVFEAIASRAKSLVGGFSSTVFRFIDGQAHLEAFTPTTPEADEVLKSTFPTPVAVFAPFRMAQSGEVTQIPDIEDQPDEPLKEVGRARGYRSMLFAPLMNKGVSIGFIGVTRVQPGRFDEHHVQLLRTFADQAVIAIGNVQLFDEVQQRTRELSKSLDDLRTAQDRLVQTEKLASLGQLTAGIAHEIKNPLNFVNNFAALSAELTDELDETLGPAPLDQKMRADVGELTQMLKSNLEKVVQHGKRADSIVRNMLLHSREGSGERRSSDLNALVSESLNLAYHGARAERSDFNITLEQHLDPDAGTAEVYPQELTRALLNLISNGFYAAVRRKMDGGGAAFEPVLSAATRNAGEAVEIRIRDNGTGIPAEIREKIFNPFFTTKPTGEGTGLGLSMTHDIIVKQHGGTIDVETEPGVFTEFRITLPRGNGAATGPK